MASEPQTVFGAPQSVEPELPVEQALDPGLTVEGYEPPPPDSYDSLPSRPGGFGLPIRAIVIGITALLLIAGVIFVISRFLSGGSGSKEATLTYWGLWEPESVMSTIIADYQRDHPNIKIEYSLQSPIEYRERLQAAIERGEGPDIFRFHNTWVPMLSRQLAPVPQDVYSNKQMQEEFYKTVTSDLSMNNKFYGIPLGIDGLVMFYNKDLLSQSGNQVPTTWEDFDNVTRAMTVKDGFGNITQAGAALGLAENIEHFSDIIGLLLYQNGTNFNNLVSDEAEKALTFYSLFAQTPNNVWDANQDNSITAFAGGKVGIIFAPSWQALTIRALNPTLSFGTAPVPQIAGGTPVSWATYWVEGVNAKSKFQKESFAFLKYLSSTDVLTKLYTEVAKDNSQRPFGEAYSRAEMSGLLLDNEYLSAVIAQAPDMRSWYLASRTKDNGINDKTIAYFKDAVNAISQGSSPRGALETAAQGVVSVLKDYGLSPK